MKTNFTLCLHTIFILIAISCTKPSQESPHAEEGSQMGQAGVKDNESQKNIVQTAIASPDHSTLVKALQAAEYVNALSNAGPFTVFAPTDAAFAKLPAGTVQELIKPENKLKLQYILEYHVYVGVIRESMINEKMTLNQVNGKNILIKKESGKLKVNEANVLATLTTSNGIIYVIDAVLQPQ